MYQVSLGHQVLCITHLPQIAILSDNHYFVSKDVKNLKTFVRTNQEFYILWEILLGANLNKARSNAESLLNDINVLLNLLKNTEEKPVDNNYVSNFTSSLRSLRNKYK